MAAKASRKADPVVSLRVRAARMGFYHNQRQRPGDVFTLLRDEDFSDHWMTRVDPDTPEHTTSAPEDLAREHGKILTEKAPGALPMPPTGNADPLGDPA